MGKRISHRETQGPKEQILTSYDNAIDKVLAESMIDWTRSSLDMRVFDRVGGKYLMKPDIVSFVKHIVRQIDQDIVTVNDYFIKGSILSFQWLKNTDFDILIEIDDVSEGEWRRIQDEIDDRFTIDVPGTEHPLQIYAHRGNYDLRNADGVYHLKGDRGGWIKGPYDVRVNIDEYMDKFTKIVASIDTSTGKLKRDLIDYEIMKDLPVSEIYGLESEIKSKIEDIDEHVRELVAQYKHVKDLRHKAFDRDMSSEEIAKYGRKNALPDNVIHKLLERYYYLTWMRELDHMIDGGEAIDTESEVQSVRDALDERP